VERVRALALARLNILIEARTLSGMIHMMWCVLRQSSSPARLGSNALSGTGVFEFQGDVRQGRRSKDTAPGAVEHTAVDSIHNAGKHLVFHSEKKQDGPRPINVHVSEPKTEQPTDGVYASPWITTPGYCSTWFPLLQELISSTACFVTHHTYCFAIYTPRKNIFANAPCGVPV
jgi:hypothetical protein